MARLGYHQSRGLVSSLRVGSHVPPDIQSEGMQAMGRDQGMLCVL